MAAASASRPEVALTAGADVGAAGPTRSLDDWLAHAERQHRQAIDLGLSRVSEVAGRLDQRQSCPLIIVGGTNGKGSTCALLESILVAAGYRVGLYTSPHLLRYNERVRIDGQAAADELLCRAFARVDAARGEIPLTYFEFGTLAAWEVFTAAGPDVVILEVGLGGRLDATNIYDAEVAVVTGVDLDHVEYLGNDREQIGFEKAGIFRPGRPAICGDADPPRRLIEHAGATGADLRVIGRDFGYQRQDGQWRYWNGDRQRPGLAHPALRGSRQLANATCALAALDALADRLPVAMQEIRRGLAEVELPGRFQVLPGRPTIVLDVAHNPQAAAVLADNLGGMGFHPATWAVFGMMRDKDIAAVIRAIAPRIDHWLPCDLGGARAASAAELAAALAGAGIRPAATFDSPQRALAEARGRAGEDDRIVVFGSFLTVAGAMRNLGRQP